MSQESALWGKYTWILFHWLAESIKEEYFQQERENIINTIKTICSSLPCPSCQGHANQYLKLRPINKIRNKDDLKKYLFIFHNAVSQRGKKQIYNESILEQYKKVNLNILLQNWVTCFSAGSHVRQDDFMLKINIQRIKNSTISYIKKNYNKFVQ